MIWVVIACENIFAVWILPCEIFQQFESYLLEWNSTTEIKKMYVLLIFCPLKLFFHVILDMFISNE